MGNNQHPKSIATTTNILANHKFVNCNPKKRNKSKPGNDSRHKKDEDKDKKEMLNEQSFTQEKVMCHCCGKDNHKALNCLDRDKIPRDQWFQKKACNNCIKALTGEDKELPE